VLSPLPDALQIPRGLNLRALSPQLTGLMEIQDLASQAVGIVCAPRAGERWWDACCGSGGKALHLADLMGETGRVLATDIRAGTLDEMTRRMRASRLRSIEIRKWDGTAAPDALFDGVLVDAPCSGLGTWHRNPDARWRTSPAEIDRLATLQLGLLRTCAQRVKPGGVLVYATCTLTAPENDGVIDEFLSDGGDFLPASFPSPLDGSTCEGRLWIYPWQAGCNGMFIARFMRKT
jgi:16S rRNA (cytosine967-C5)-methyltransferase